jgi:hypothetical protein
VCGDYSQETQRHREAGFCLFAVPDVLLVRSNIATLGNVPGCASLRMVLVGHVGRRLSICTVRIQDNQQNVDQDREYRDESAHEEQDGFDKHYEHREH